MLELVPKGHWFFCFQKPLTTCNSVLEVEPCEIPVVLLGLSTVSLCYSSPGNHPASISWVHFTWRVPKTMSASRCPGPLRIFSCPSHCIPLSNFGSTLTMCLSISQSLFQVSASVVWLLHIHAYEIFQTIAFSQFWYYCMQMGVFTKCSWAGRGCSRFGQLVFSLELWGIWHQSISR